MKNVIKQQYRLFKQVYSTTADKMEIEMKTHCGITNAKMSNNIRQSIIEDVKIQVIQNAIEGDLRHEIRRLLTWHEYYQ